MLELFSYGFMQNALLGGIGIAVATSLIGPFLVLRRMSLLGDGLAHLAFGGIALGLLLNYNPILVALLFVIAGSFFIQHLIKNNIFGESAIALVLSFGVGLGIVLTGIARGFNADLFSFLIGSILTLNSLDLTLIFTVAALTVIFSTVFYKDMVFSTFNSELAKIQSKRLAVVNALFTILIALVVVIGIRAVGILLESALIVIPTLIALLLSRSFKGTVLICLAVSLLSILVGIVLSFILDIPPSGTIVMILFFGFILASLYRNFSK